VLLYKQPLDGEVDEAAHWDFLTCSQSSGTSRPARMCSAALAASSSPMPKPAVTASISVSGSVQKVAGMSR
jgi:hypothetical protein